jgi:uncharacterized protein (TIGR02452 family)
MPTRADLIALADDTLRIVASGVYHPDGADPAAVDISGAIADACAGTEVITPERWTGIVERERAPQRADPAVIEVTGETTLAAIRRLLAADDQPDILALNFASARSVGGGFRTGAVAQEESLARASALAATLELGTAYYAENRRCRSLLYTDHAIISPRVPIFRCDDGRLLPRPDLATFVTVPAPNPGAMAVDDPDRQRVADTLERRMRQLFALASATGHRRLVLGAWGCGVFRNDPEMVSSGFQRVLAEGWRARFARIVFAVYDPRPERPVLARFRLTFAEGGAGCA